MPGCPYTRYAGTGFNIKHVGIDLFPSLLKDECAKDRLVVLEIF